MRIVRTGSKQNKGGGVTVVFAAVLERWPNSQRQMVNPVLNPLGSARLSRPPWYAGAGGQETTPPQDPAQRFFAGLVVLLAGLGPAQAWRATEHHDVRRNCRERCPHVLQSCVSICMYVCVLAGCAGTVEADSLCSSIAFSSKGDFARNHST